METTAPASVVEEFDPLDDPQVRAAYESIKKQHGQIAADRYLLQARPTAGMTAATPTVVTRDRSQAQRRVAPQLSDPLPSSLALHGSDAMVNALLPGDEATEEGETAVVLTPAAGVAQTAIEAAVTTPAQALKATSSVTTTGGTPQRERKPARSTAEVKQAFEAALAEFVKADKPFKRSHVLAKAGLGASFYDTYPLLRTKVDEAIANVGKPKPQTQPEVETMSSTVNEPSTTTPVEAETPVEDEAVEPQTALTAPAAIETVDDTAGQLATADSTALSSNHRTVTGLTWGNMSELAAHWRDEQERLKQQISQLLVDLDTATENAEAYERVLKLHTPQLTEETHGQ